MANLKLKKGRMLDKKRCGKVLPVLSSRASSQPPSPRGLPRLLQHCYCDSCTNSAWCVLGGSERSSPSIRWQLALQRGKNRRPMPPRPPPAAVRPAQVVVNSTSRLTWTSSKAFCDNKSCLRLALGCASKGGESRPTPSRQMQTVRRLRHAVALHLSVEFEDVAGRNF